MLKTNRIASTTLTYVLLGIIAIVCLFPYIWLLSSSFKPETKIFIIPPQILPDPFTIVNYIDAFMTSGLLRWLLNTAYITIIVVIGGSIVSSMAGYAYSKIRFPGSSLLFLIPLCAMMIPNEVIIIPLFQIWSKLNMVNQYLPLILPNIIGAGGMFGVFLFRQFYLSIPYELVEAAKIDGSTPFGTFFKIFLPLSQSTIATLAIFNFMNTWNDFLDPLIYLNSTQKYTVALGLTLYSGMNGVMWGQLMAACVVATLPLTVMFFIAQSKFIESVAVTGMKN